MDKYVDFNVYGGSGCLYVAIIMQLTFNFLNNLKKCIMYPDSYKCTFIYG